MMANIDFAPVCKCKACTVADAIDKDEECLQSIGARECSGRLQSIGKSCTASAYNLGDYIPREPAYCSKDAYCCCDGDDPAAYTCDPCDECCVDGNDVRGDGVENCPEHCNCTCIHAELEPGSPLLARHAPAL